ncbi:MAG: carboxypeptidase-like regulatory domain-containing protein [Firmicutes bacterium]|nr:carboxypeptidase-like regulatory domain-containing protein [Bacillota bacterium]
MKRAFFVLAVLCLCLTTTGCLEIYFGGYASLSGMVYGQVEGQPLAGAAVEVKPRTAGYPTYATVTNGSGAWSVPPVRLDRYDVTASKQGYTTQNKTVDVGARNGVFVVNFVLEAGED